MKASIKKGTKIIQGFHNDDYDFDNSNHPDSLMKIKEFSGDINIEDIEIHNAKLEGVFPYYLDKGIVKKKVLAEMPEYILVKEKQRNKEYIEKTDGTYIKAFRELLQVSPNLKSLLSSETQALIAQAELKVQEIKDTI